MKVLKLLLFVLSFHLTIQKDFTHAPEQGSFTFELTSAARSQVLTKILYNQTAIKLTVIQNPEKCKSDKDLNIRWLIRGSTCKGEFGNSDLIETLMQNPSYPSGRGAELSMYLTNGYEYDENVFTGGETIHCTNSNPFKLFSDWKVVKKPVDDVITTKTLVNATKSPVERSRKRRAGEDESEAVKDEENPSVPSATSETISTKPQSISTAKPKVNELQKVSALVPFMGEYIFVVFIDEDAPEDVSFLVTVDMHSPVGYLSAHEYPLLTFYMIMCIVYVFYAAAWLLLSACNYRDLLRVQFWIGGVILLGMIEKAVHYAEYSNVNSSGISYAGTEKFAEVVSALKRAVARMLVIIVSLGFGIVKPRLGPMLHRVLGIGVLYFVLAVLEAMSRIDMYFHPSTRESWVIMYIPLAVVDAIICWWIFVSLLQTMKTLRLRRNVVKLTLYRHFANTILFCVVVSVIMMLWTIHSREKFCFTDFNNFWLETACWHILFSVILLVIMILWRPNANNQRYAYSPMIDGDGSDNEEMEEPMLGSGATENVKMRGTKSYVKSDVDRTEEDLKWIEEHIPQTVADAALPALMDSDEEIMNTKYEMSKME